MKKQVQLIAGLSLCLCMLLTACVTKRKYLESETRAIRLQQDSAKYHTSLDECTGKLDEAGVRIRSLEKDKAMLQSQNATIQNNLEDVSNTSKMTIEEQQKRLNALQNLIQGQRDVMNKLKKSIADALVNFKPDELSVYIKDGNVYVSLEEKLLFKSGSAVVDPKGKEAIGKLAMVLNNTADVTVLIEGHTDTVPIRTSRFEDNWDLSTSRAVSIVRILTKDYGVDPHRITASGRGEFHPVQTNSTEGGKTANRRTEIILAPNLSELYKLLSQ
ncbi:MAG: OmpA family protein [Chitinophagales bacterium]